MIKKILKILIVLLLIAFIVMMILGASFYYNWWGNGDPDGQVHISINGVSDVFEDLTEHRDEYTSIYDNDTLSFLKYCHDTYGATFTLYCYFETDDFNMTMVPDTYLEEFEETHEWLSFGFYAKSDIKPTEEVTPDQLSADFVQFMEESQRITGNGHVTLRLADWELTPEAVDALKQRGVSSLFTVSDEKAGYYFTEEQNAMVLAEDSYLDETIGMMYYITDLCLDEGRINAVYGNLIRTALNEKQNAIIAVCAQESSLDASMKEKIENVCIFTQNYEYEFAAFESEDQ